MKFAAPSCRAVFAFVFIVAVGQCSTLASAEDAAAASTSPAAEIDRLLTKSFPADAPGAAVLVVNNGEVLLRKGYGMADLELNVPIDPAQIFRLGSVTKQFTAVAILQLVEAGKIRLDDEITKYVPDYSSAGKVTLQHLLTHTAGVPNYTEQPEWLKTIRQDLTVDQVLAFTKDKPLEFEPGTNWKYSNTGYILLGAVVEKASGQSYADYIQTHLFTPAGMTNSSYGSDTRLIHGRVPGYTRAGKDKPWNNSFYLSMTQPFSAGGLLSTVDDLWKWEQALAEGRLVSPALLEQARSQAHLADGRGTGYGFGWRIGSIAGHKTVDHGGSIPGFSSFEMSAHDAGFFVAILSNADRPVAPPTDLVARIAKLVLGKPTVVGVRVPDSVMQECAGVYRTIDGKKFELSVEDGKLFGREPDRDRLPAVAISANEFQIPATDFHFTVLRDPMQRVDRLLVGYGQPGMELYWPRIDEPFDAAPSTKESQKAPPADGH